jgi:glycosyltransferase involved in cell wall biosynthesis
MKNILILIPCFNEQGRIGAVIDSLNNEMPDCDITVINDASTDNTAAEASAKGATVLSHSCNLGYGAALETGYQYAIRYGYDIALQMDGDGQHQTDQLRKILAPVVKGEADITVGSRYDNNGTASLQMPLVRRFGHRLFSILLGILTGMRFNDPTSGFQCLNSKALKLFSCGVFPCDYPDSDVILMAQRCGLRIKEINVQMKERQGGTSMHAGMKPFYYGLKMFLSIFIVLLNRNKWQAWKKNLQKE